MGRKNINSGIYKKGEINLDDLIQDIKQHNNIASAGSIHTFSGIVRASSKDGRAVKGMKIDAYKELADPLIQQICNEITEIDGIIEVKIIHFFGEFDLTEDLVHVVVAAAHRKEGFRALHKAVDKYKNELAVWKKEIFVNGSSKWIH